MNARQMLAGLPVRRFAEGGDVTDAQIRDFLAANAGASDAQIAQVMNQYGVTPARLASAAGYDPQEVTRRYEAALPLTTPTNPPAVMPQMWQPGESIGRQRAIESGNEANWLTQVKASADAYMARATPATAAEAYDAMVQSGIGIKDLLDAGVSQMTIDKALSVETDAEQKAVNTLTQRALTSTLAQNPNVAPQLATRGAQDVYAQSRQFVENLQKDGLTPEERRYMQQVASQQGWGYADIRAAGIDPNILFDDTAAAEAERQRLAAAAAEAERQRLAAAAAAEAERQRLAAAAAAEAERQRLAAAAAAEAERQRLAAAAAAEAERQRLAAAAAAEAERQRLAAAAAAEAERQRKAAEEAAEAERKRLADAQVVAPGVTTGDMVRAVTPTYSAQDLRNIIKAAEQQPAPLGTVTNPMDTRGTAETGSQSGVSEFLETYTAPTPFTPPEYTAPTVYSPEKFARENAGADLYEKGEVALDTAFRQSPVRTVSPVTGQYMYTPAASLRPATGAGWSWTPPVVTSRPRQLLDVAPTDSASQLYALSRREQDRALRDAFTKAKVPLGGQDVYSWQSRLRSGDYTNDLTGAFDTTRFNQDFESWSAGRGSGTSGTSGQPDAGTYDAMGNPIQPVDPMQLQPKMFLGFADGGDVRARELLDQIKKPEGVEEQTLGAEGTYSQEPGKAVVLNPQEQEFAEGGLVPAPSPRMARAAQLAAQRAEQPQTESRSMLERLQRFTSLDQPQDMSLGETVADIGMGFLPVVGTAQGARDFERARRDEDKLGMLLSAASMIPVAGGLVRGARSAGKAADDLAALTAKAPTDTPEFKNFFGESKVVNDAGQPLRVFHGTNVDFDQFATDIRSGRRRFIPGELGTWFGSTPEVANSFARGVITPREGGVVYPVYLSIQNPKVYDSYEAFLEEMQGRRSASTVKRELQKQGFDGIQIKNSTTDFGGLRDDWVAFKPTQIKSAIGNVGTYDPSNPVITKAKGGEVSASPTPEELLAQIDRSMASSPASAQGTASSAQPDTVQGDSRSMLRRISDTFGKNVTAPVVGSMLDMTVGVGDLAQMGIKAGAQKLGIETKPFTPVSSAIQESLGVAGYDPYSPAAIATAIGLPAAAALRAAGTAARGSRPLMSEAMPRTPSGRRPAPGSAEELLSRLAPIVDREAAVFASSELAAMGAREVAPDNFTAEVAAAIAGGGAYNTLDNILSSVAPTTARSQMAEIYRHTPTRENPFVGRIDTYVANLPGRIGRDELLAQMQGKFRNADILRVRRALEDVDPKAKLQPNEILEKIKQEYDPSDLRVTTIAPGQFREKGLTFYENMDNPWRGMPPELAPEQGVIVLSRPPVSGVRNYTRREVGNAEAALSNFNLMVASLNEDMDVGARQQLFNSLSEPLFDALYSLGDFGADKRGELFELLDKAAISAQHAEDIFHLGERLERAGQDLPPDALNEEKNKLLARGGLEPSQVLDQAYANVFKRKFEKEIAEASNMAGFPATRRIIQSLPTPDNVTNAQQASEFLSNTFMPAIARAGERARQTQGNLLVGYIEELRDSGVDKSLRQMIEDSKVPARAGVNPGYVGQHRSLTGTEKGQIGFSRTSDVVASLPNMSYARGIYLHEMQSDLLDDISTTQGRIASGATLTEVKNSIQRLEEKFSNSFKEKAGDSFSNSPEDEEVMERFLRDVLNDPEDRRGTVELYSRTYPQIFSPNLLYWLSGEGYKNVLKPLQRARERAEQLEQPEANRRARTSGFSLDEAFPGMMSDSKTLQQMFMKTAVRSAMDRGMNFVALTIPERPYSSQPQLYERVPQNARDVVKDLGEGFRLEQIRMRSPRDYTSNSFPVLAITWDQSTAEGREGVNRIMTQGVPFRHGGEVTTQPDDLKNLLSFLDKKPAHKRK